MKTDPWHACKTINGPDPKKQSSWGAGLHQDKDGNCWCDNEFAKLVCPWGNHEKANT